MGQSVPNYEVTSDDKLWGLLSYLINPIVPIVVLLMEDKKNRPFLKAHVFQALGWFIFVTIVTTILSFITFGIGGCLALVAYVVITIIWALKAYKGELVNIPVITDFVTKQGWSN
jgi:uncharacterized membrane protein